MKKNKLRVLIVLIILLILLIQYKKESIYPSRFKKIGMGNSCNTTVDCDAINPGLGYVCYHNLCSGLVVIQMDDTQGYWLTDVANAVVTSFNANQIYLVTEVIPEALNTDTTFLNYVQAWNTYAYIEIAQGQFSHSVDQSSMSYSQTITDLNKGKAEFTKAGIKQPFTFVPAYDYGNVNTLNALNYTGFHTELDYSTAPVERNGITAKPLTIDDGIEVTTETTIMTQAQIKSAIDTMIASKRFANIACHMQDFESGGGGINTAKINSLVTSLKNIKSQGYTFITAEQYFAYVTCIPKTCQELGYICGIHDNGCGGMINCGICYSDFISYRDSYLSGDIFSIFITNSNKWIDS